MKMKNKGFTLAEVLITLVIIGIIASMTIPTMMANSKKLEVETKLKQTYSILNNALTRAVADNGPIHTWDEMRTTKESQAVSMFKQFVAPYLNFNKKIQDMQLKDLGYSDIYYSDGKTVYREKDKSAAIAVLNNGTVIVRINPWNVKDKETEDQHNYYAVQYVIDIDGPKGRNMLGKDVFCFLLYTTGTHPMFEMTGVNSPTQDSLNALENDENGIIVLEKNSKETIMKQCKDEGGQFCGALIQNNGWKIPKDYPIKI